jgi:hypothetical protein
LPTMLPIGVYVPLSRLAEFYERAARGQKILASCQEGMMAVGKRFETGEYFISDVMTAGR